MNSETWFLKSRQTIYERGNECERCGLPGYPHYVLQVHHLNYDRLGFERDEDLQVLCLDCHEEADAERKREVAAQQAAALWNARVNGWATKKYGEDWEEYMDPIEVEEEFYNGSKRGVNINPSPPAFGTSISPVAFANLRDLLANA
jgi:hypothetical protein